MNPPAWEFPSAPLRASAVTSKLIGLAQELSERLELPVEVLDPFRNIKVDPKKFDPDYLSEIVPEMAVAVGLAVRGV